MRPLMHDLEKVLAVLSIKKKLIDILNAPHTSHAFLFYGGRESNSSFLAKAFAKDLLLKNDANQGAKLKLEKESHPDLKILSLVEKANFHTVASIRKCIEEVESAPFEAKLKVIVIEEADKMQEPAANALLKTLEEPPSKAVFILLAKSLSGLLPTIVSRCMKIYIPPISKNELVSYLVEEKGQEESKANLLAFFSFGSLEKAEKLLEKERPYLEELFLEVLKELSNPSYVHFMQKLEKFDQASQKLEDFSSREVFEMLDFWFRDKEESGPHVFFQEEAESLEKQRKLFSKTSQQIFAFLLEMQKAHLCNIKLKTCLESLYLKLQEKSARA